MQSPSMDMMSSTVSMRSKHSCYHSASNGAHMCFASFSTIYVLTNFMSILAGGAIIFMAIIAME